MKKINEIGKLLTKDEQKVIMGGAAGQYCGHCVSYGQYYGYCHTIDNNGLEVCQCDYSGIPESRCES